MIIFYVKNSYWPLILRFIIYNFIVSILYSINKDFISLFLLFNILMLRTNLYLWRKDLSRERSYLGSMPLALIQSIKLGFALFIIREVIFFLAFFWSYFHFMLICPSELVFWPPIMLRSPSFKTLSLFNTVLLLSRGFTLTNSHQFFLLNNEKIFKICNGITITFSVIFLAAQNTEYFLISFVFTDTVFMAGFYITTFFHGVHVLIGRVFILFSSQKTKSNFLELAAWYWHFVDVVWLLLFLFFYWWVS